MENPSGRSPKRELLGPRPTPLKVRKESHKIKKLPMPPPQQQPRPPVIIYTVSPKVIHAQPNEFMSLVQRLTGPGSSSEPTDFSDEYDGGGISPATRIASIEKTRPPQYQQVVDQDSSEYFFQLEGIEIGSDLQIGNSQFPGILSPNPNSLPPIPRNIFSPTPDSTIFGFSPLLQSARNQNHLVWQQIQNQNQFEDINNLNSFQSPGGASSFLLSPQLNIYSPSTFNLLRSLFDI